MKEAAEMKFEFQEISLQEAEHLAMAGKGRFSELRLQLMERLPNLPPDKAFAFGLGKNGALQEKEMKTLLGTLNSALKKSRINWYVSYSSSKKLFVCVPRDRDKLPSKFAPRLTSETVDLIIKMRGEGMRPRHIAEKLSIKLHQVYGALKSRSLQRRGLIKATPTPEIRIHPMRKKGVKV